MDSMPLHPALVHIPLGLAVGAPFLMTGMAVAFRRGRLARSAWSIAVCLQALVFAGGLWAMNAGHAEEERVEEIVAERYIHEHEERGEAFVWAAGVTLLLTASVLVLKESMALQAAAV
ncbi:MAG TPA: hypothetical protein VFL30_06695, partial [Rhodanobacteraceae bacterium]|nr:hypothetical protein [Rhodanobacteraceae bacterium]